ncbi:MAG: DUF11 domain-containing protein [Acidobacteria bacterium]|nr:DUF11 domain-containing protein [Acidobacteriota bacterium]MBV9478700.1 DUF11 domain-containing protein [Acidobacteriota bacterium]
MNRRWSVVVAVAALCLAPALYGTTNYQSNGAGGGDWLLPTTWSPLGIPGAGDTVTIVGTDTVIVTGIVSADSITVQGGQLELDLAGFLTANTVTVNAAFANAAVVLNGGALTTTGNIDIDGGSSTSAQLQFGALGGTLNDGGSLNFAGLLKQLTFSGAGTLNIAGDLGAGASFLAGGSTINFNGSGPQTINAYTFHDFSVSKATGTATLNGPITVNGSFAVTSGVLDDGGNQISLNAGSSSSITIGTNGVLKLGSAGSATSFPTPYASIFFSPGSTVVYHAGVAQSVNDALTYQNLWITTAGGSVTHTSAGPTLNVNGTLTILNNGANTATLSIGSSALDLNGNLAGDGTLSATSGAINISGDWAATTNLSAGTGSTVTYDGAFGSQNVGGVTYNNLTINKLLGTATLAGAATVNGNLNITAGSFDTGGQSLTVGGTLTNGSTLVAGASNVILGGNFTNNGALSGASATFKLNGTAAQTWTNNVGVTVGTLEMNNPVGATLSGAGGISVSTLLKLNGANVTVGGGGLFVDVLALISRTSGWIIGPLTLGMNPSPARTFPIGTAFAYLPVDADSGSAGQLTIEAVEGKHPSRTGNNVLDRYWRIESPSSVTPIDALTFHYNAGDVTTGTESQYGLAQYSAGIWTRKGDVVDEVNHNAGLTNVTGYFSDWIIGQPGSTGGASKLAITGVNGGSDPGVGAPFAVNIESQNDSGTPTSVSSGTVVALSVLAGAGPLGGTTSGTIFTNNSTLTINNVTYGTAENGVVLRATATSGDTLAFGDSTLFNVTAATTLTVTSLADSGAGTLRDAIATANGGGCTSPCTINFSVSGTINLTSALPTITASNLTIDGFTAPASLANTNAFGLAFNAFLGITLDGGSSTAAALDVQAIGAKIRGLVIRHFTSYGVRFSGTNTGSILSGCSIGTDGGIAAANGIGVYVDGANGVTIGGTAPADRNLISGNTNAGVSIINASSNITVEGNYIGTSATVTNVTPNTTGVTVGNGCTAISVGVAGTGNIISGNNGNGVELYASGTVVRANIIGGDGLGLGFLANGHGIYIAPGAGANTIGGASPADANTIVGNSGDGIRSEGTGDSIQNNRIGVAVDGTTAHGNSGSGIRLQGNASGNGIGWMMANTIAYNTGDGVSVIDTAIGNAIRTNAIYGNGGNAIDLGDDGPTANDATDSDTGPNGKQNYPSVSSAHLNGANLDVTFSLDSSGGTNANYFLVDVYKADGTGQAAAYVGSSTCLAGPTLATTYTFPAGSLTTGDKVVLGVSAYSDAGCATNSEGTSELSPSATVSGDVHWTGLTGAWELASNWLPAHVPTTNDNVYIDASGTYTVTLSSPASFNALHVGAASGTQTLGVNGSLSIGAPSSVDANGVFTLNSNLSGNGSLDVNSGGTLNWITGTIGGSAALNINSGATATLSSANTKVLSARLLTVATGGNLTWSGGTFFLQTGAAIANHGTFAIQSDATLADNGGAGAFDNYASVTKSVTTGVTTFGNVAFNHHSGTLDIQTGSINPANGTATAAISIGSSSELTIDSDTFTLGTGTSFSGTGALHVTGGTLTADGTFSVPNFKMDGGTLNGSGTISLAGGSWTTGTMSGSGTSTIPNAANISFSTANTKTLARALTIATGGTATWSGGTFFLQSGGTITNNGTFDAASDATMADNGGAGAFTNNNLFRKSAGSATATLLSGITLNNNGNIQVLTGTLNPATINNVGALSLTGELLVDSDTVTLSAGTTVSGSGTLKVTGGTLTIDGSPSIPLLRVDAGTVNGSGNFTSANLQWNSGTFSGSGTTTIPNLGVLTLGTGNTKVLARSLVISSGGVATVTGTGTLFLQSGGNITNNGLFGLEADSTIADNGAAGAFTNNATLRKSVTTGSTILGGITLNSTGTLDLQTGTLDLAGGTASGTLSLTSGAVFAVNSDSYTLSGTTVTGSGLVQLSGGALLINGSVTIPKFQQNGGTLDGTGTFTVGSLADWSTGTQQGSGTTSVANGAKLTLSSANTKVLMRALQTVAGGTLEVNGSGTMFLQSGGSIANNGALDLKADNTLTNGGAAGTIVNNGTITKSTTFGTTAISSIAFTNNGTLDLQSGIVNVAGAYTQSGTGTLHLWLGGTTPGTQYSQLVTASNPSLAGTLTVSLNGPYQPNGGDSFRALSIPGGTHAGDFNHPYGYPALALGRTFSDAFDTNGLLLTVSGNADLSIAKTAPSNVLAGNPINYTLTVSNAGPDAASGVTVTDLLPAGHSGITASGTGWNCNVVTLTVTCTATSMLATGAAPAITISATTPSVPSTILNTATVASANDTNAGNDSGSATVTLDAPQADVELTSQTPAGSVATSTPVSITFVLTNHGPQSATGVTLTATIPSSLAFNGATPASGSCGFAAGTLTCNVGTIAPLGSVNVVVNLTTGTTTGTQTPNGSVTAIETDPNPGNNSIPAPISVGGSSVTVTNVNDSGDGSLRQALLDAQSNVCASPCTIAFNIGSGVMIQPTSDLPALVTGTILDATTQPGYSGAPVLQLDLSLDPGNTAGLHVSGNNVTIRGLAITKATSGIEIDGNNAKIESNFIGIDLTDVTAANGIGMLIRGNNNTIGGGTAAKRNVISGNTTAGVQVESSATGNVVAGNFIGVDASGNLARANGTGVKFVAQASSNTIGGSAAEANVISGNTSYGVFIEGGATNATADANVVSYNSIGPSASGTIAFGASLAGVAVNDNAGATQIHHNTISGNGNGVELSGSGTTGAVVHSNLIGLASDGVTLMGNVQAGLVINGASDSVIGGTANGGNTISGNATNGINVVAGSGNEITGNTILAPSGLPIDLGADGATPNDIGDGDTGPNGRQNSPTLTGAFLDGGGNLHLSYNIDSSATSNGSILVEFFKASSGQPQTFLTRVCTAANAFGNGTSLLPSGIALGNTIVATATSYADNACNTIGDGTSEVSNAVVVTACTPPPVSISGPSASCAGNSVTLNAGSGYASYLWSTGAATQSITVSPTSTTTFTVTVTDANGCSNSASKTVNVTAAPVAAIAGPSATCAGTPVTLDAGAGFASYLWSNGATTQQITVTPSSTTSYSVTVGNGTCTTTSAPHTVTVSSTPVATITAPATVCAGSTGHVASAPTQAGATYNWIVTNGTLTAGQGTNSITFTAGATGNVALSVTATQGTCTSNGSTSVPIVQPPVVTITGPTTACPSTQFTLDAGSGYASYQWSNGATTPTITLAQLAPSAVYSVTVTTAAGCSATASHTVTLSAAPSAVITAPSSVTASSSGNAASVAATAGATYAWSVTNGHLDAGQGTSAIAFTAGASGNTVLHVTVTAGGCSSSSTKSVVNSGGNNNNGADLAITKTAPSSVNTGATLVYTINVVNHGPSAAAGVSITDDLPAGTTLLSIDDGPWTCGAAGSSIFCSGNAAAGASSTILLTVTAPQQPGTIVNHVAIDAATPDPDATNNSASAATNVVSPAPNCTSVPPSLVAPADGATNLTSPVTFTWSPVSGAAEYELWLDDQLAGSTTSATLTHVAPSGTNHWFVVARFTSGCDALTSATRTFDVTPNANCDAHTKTQITAPALNSTINAPVTFSWMPVPQAIGYRVWVDVDGGGLQDVGTTDGAIFLTANVPPGAVVAYVDALFSGCPPVRSDGLAFNVARPDPCASRATAAPIAPANNAVVASSSIDFQWTAASGASEYRVWAEVDDAPAALLGTTSDTILHATIAHGSIRWWIEALYDGCASTTSATSRFTVPAAQSCGTAVPSLVSPANGANVAAGNVTFSWSSVDGALGYELWLSHNHGTPALAGTTATTSLAHVVPAGTLTWFVRVLVDRCPARDSQRATFTATLADACAAHKRAVLVAPLRNAEVTSPAAFAWNGVAGATGYEVFVVRGHDAPQRIASTTATAVNGIALTPGRLRWFVRASFGGTCPALDSDDRRVTIVATPAACAPLEPPSITAPGQISANLPFLLQWTPSAGATAYQLQVASSANFSDAQLITTTGTQQPLVRPNDGHAPVALYARVRAIDTRCQPSPTVSAYGSTSAIFILPNAGEASAPFGQSGTTSFSIPLGSEFAGQGFTATPNQPWLTVTPASGVVPPSGITLHVVADAASLPVGTSLGGVRVALTGASSSNAARKASSVFTSTMTMNLVTPVSPVPHDTPPPDALIIPAVAHATGINSQFESDVRVTNASPEVVQYQLTFTPSGEDGISDGRQTTFSIEPGNTIALDDILRTWFGTGSGSIAGVLEVRPLTQTAPFTSSAAFSGLADLTSFASSRTFNVTPNGTFGQYIPAIPFANFVGGLVNGSRSVISLQQVAQSDRYRTNLGIVEGSGEPASLTLTVFGSNGQQLGAFPIELAGGEHRQLNLGQLGVPSLDDGRVEVAVTSPGGKITAYASVLDNQTNDPLLVSPVTLNDQGATKWVIPGVADLDNGTANWQTDMRLFNASTTDVDALLSFYSQNGGTPRTQSITIPAGQVRELDRTLSSVFGASNDGGAVHVETASPARLIATARTYNQTTHGTYGQFISGVTPAEAAGIENRPLQLLQVEESDRFRSNIGLAEVTGNPVTIELSVLPPDAKVTAVTELTLGPNEFRQLNSLLQSVGLANTYNARVTVRVIGGTGRVTAYASVIDMQTNDPTYVPAQ